jgi:isopenicillin-N epimerase
VPAEPSAPVTDDDANPHWGPDWPEVRAMWPLEPTVAHVNHGSYGAVLRPVLEEQQSWRDRMESNPVRFFNRELPDALDHARTEVAAFLGADPAALAFVHNATSAASTVFAGFPLEAGDSVLVTDHAYGAVLIGARRWTARAGARLDTVHVPLDADDATVAKTVLDAVGDRTRLVLLDQVTSPTARRMPLVDLVPALQARGAAVVVDGAHAPGMLAVDVEGLGADFWFGNLHKWCCAPRGTAVLHAAERWRGSLQPLVASWGEEAGFPRSFDDVGSDDLTSWLSAPRALRVLEGLGLDRLRRHNAELAVAGQLAVAEALHIDRAELPRDPAVSMQLVPLPDGTATDPWEAAALQARIGDAAAVEVGVTSWAGRGFLRLSAQAYNAPADYARLAAELPGLL